MTPGFSLLFRMPAYDYDNWFVIFFAIFIIVNLYIFMSIVLATIYYNYKKNLKVQHSENFIRRHIYIYPRKRQTHFGGHIPIPILRPSQVIPTLTLFVGMESEIGTWQFLNLFMVALFKMDV